MKRTILVVPVLLFSFGMTSWLAQANNNPSTKTAWVETVLEWLDTEKSTVKWERHKVVKNSTSTFMLGKSKVNMSIADATYNTTGDLKIKHGSWTYYDGHSINKQAKIVIDLKSAVGLQVSDNEKLEFASPNYLDVVQYPTTTLELETGVGFGTDNYKEIVGKLTIKNTTKSVEIKLADSSKNMDYANLQCSFTIDGKEWGLINPNVQQEIVEDKLTFHCSFIVKL